MIVLSWIASFVLLLTLTAGCGSVSTGDDGNSVNTDDLIKDRKYQYSLARFVSSPAMETYLKEAIKKQTLDSLSGGDIFFNLHSDHYQYRQYVRAGRDGFP